MKVIKIIIGIIDEEPITMYMNSEGLLFWDNVNKLPIEGIHIIGTKDD